MAAIQPSNVAADKVVHVVEDQILTMRDRPLWRSARLRSGLHADRKVWRQLVREGEDVARCTVARLMRGMGLQGVIRGRRVRTTISDKAAPCPLDRVNRQFRAPRPNVLWVSDFTYVATRLRGVRH